MEGKKTPEVSPRIESRYQSFVEDEKPSSQTDQYNHRESLHPTYAEPEYDNEIRELKNSVTDTYGTKSDFLRTSPKYQRTIAQIDEDNDLYDVPDFAR